MREFFQKASKVKISICPHSSENCLCEESTNDEDKLSQNGASLYQACHLKHKHRRYIKNIENKVYIEEKHRKQRLISEVQFIRKCFS